MYTYTDREMERVRERGCDGQRVGMSGNEGKIGTERE